MPRAFLKSERLAIVEALLKNASTMIARVGLRKLSIAPLCKQAGISKGAFYLFFKSKEDLIVQVLLREEATYRGQLEELAQTGSLGEVLKEMLTGIFRHPVLVRLTDNEDLAWLMVRVDSSVWAENKRDDAQFFRSIAQVLVGRGLLTPEVDLEVFVGLPTMGLAVASRSDLLGEQAQGLLRSTAEGFQCLWTPRGFV